MLSHNLRYCPSKTQSLAYCTLVRLKLEYCASEWDPYQQQDIDAFERINRRAARVVYNKTWRERGVSPTALLKDLGWDPLSDRRRQHRLSLMYRITHGLVAVPPTRLENPSRNTKGHSFKYKTIDQSHRYGCHQAACREPAGSNDKTTRTAICFEHKTQYILIRAPYTRIVVFWHISNIPPMISQSQISCNTPTFYIATIFVKYCYTTGSWLL